jgi:hypothetical protein
MNYTTLKAGIVSWLNNESTELAANLDQIIKNAENRILRESDLRLFRKHATAYLGLPTDCLVVRYIRLNTGDFLELRAESFIREYTPNSATTGTPKYYAHWDANTIFLAPTPSAASAVEISYTYSPASIVTAATTWLGTNAEDVLFAACVYEGAIYLQAAPDLLTMYKTSYTEAMQRLQLMETRNSSDEFKTKGLI